MSRLGRILCALGLHRDRWTREGPRLWPEHRTGVPKDDLLLVTAQVLMTTLRCDCARCGRRLA